MGREGGRLLAVDHDCQGRGAHPRPDCLPAEPRVWVTLRCKQAHQGRCHLEVSEGHEVKCSHDSQGRGAHPLADCFPASARETTGYEPLELPARARETTGYEPLLPLYEPLYRDNRLRALGARRFGLAVALTLEATALLQSRKGS